MPRQGGQRQVTPQELNAGRGLSRYGRITSPYPLWDGTNRVLIAYRPCAVTRNSVPVLCTTLTSEEFARVDDEDRLAGDAAADPIQFYGYYTLDFEKDGQVIGMLSVNGYNGQVFLHTWHGTFIEEAE